ncbi:MAG TPA: FecR family protein [Polyangiaceae bacterium]|jgi:ferric-dicitrate binding protein FerR (iron transport regulator)|nr:FecR family protein [Polyangiaceae bacterium]
MPDAIKDAERESAELSPQAAELATLARRALGFMSEAQRAEGLAGLREALARRTRRTRRSEAWRVPAMATAGAAAACVAFLVVRGHAPPPDLSFRVDGAALEPGGAVDAAASEHPVVRFSDGSELALEPRSRVHVHVLGEHGARVILEEGNAHLDVVHTPETRWVVGAGPFVVAVTGTAFGIGWAASEQRLDVRLENGSVSVTGPVSDAPLALRAGQWLTVRGGDVLIRDLGASAALLPSPDPRSDRMPDPKSDPGAPEGPPGAPPDSHVHDAHDARPAPSWAAELAAGKFDAIVADATRRGLPAAYATSRAADLAALADAARYIRREDVARSALDAERRRFPGTDYAHVAAFSLGRLSETEGDLPSALSWYEVYLKEAPAGTFASEALGRKMVTVEHLDGRDAAIPLGQAYLARFPDGTYAKAAKALVLTPHP